jgi:prepilin-type N-terminal cleavage/methylation domain-containing protein/prepilin-type processing-associated H-X9-DG protein
MEEGENHMTKNIRNRHGFTLVELLVVIGIIAVLLGILLPSLSKAQAYARKVQCMSNMRQCYASMLMYANDNKGYLFPMGPDEMNPVTGNLEPSTLGYPPRDGTPKSIWTYIVWTGRCDPPEMVCPIDNGNYPTEDEDGKPADPVYWHSYVINKHLANYRIKVTAHGSQLNNKAQTEVVLMGEKFISKFDYFMEPGDFDRLIDLVKHGLEYGSNYLYLDGHVDSDSREGAMKSFDPWDLAAPTPPAVP